MKKIFSFILFIALYSNASSQILTRSENWPNINWSVSGVYTAAALVFNPTVDDKFKYDAALVVPSGGSSTVFVASPIFNLKPAFDGGEKALKFDFNISYAVTAASVLTVQYWNADTSSWVIMADGNAPIGGQGTISTCTNSPVSLFFDFSGFTNNQLQNFRYRFAINDAGNQLTGICVNSPVLISLSCSPPTNLAFSNATTTSVTLDWMGVGSTFEFEYGLQGFTLGTGARQQVTIHPVGLNGLAPGTIYDFYVREDCSQNQIVLSNWAGPKTFTTTTLGLEEQTLNGFKLYPNPTKNTISMASEKVLNEIKVFNLAGQELMKLRPNKAQTIIDLTPLASGFYFIKVSTDAGLGTYKVLKN